MRFQRFLNQLFIFILIFSACKKEKTDSLPTDTVKTGKLVGRVVLTDEFGIVYPSSAGLLVTADTASTSFSAVTDANGNFEITGMSSGTYNLTYTKTGYGTYKRFGYPVDASNSSTTTVTPTDTLGEKSTTLVSNLSDTVYSASQTMDILCTVSGPPDSTHRRGIRLFFAKDSLVSFSSYLYSPDSTWNAVSASGVISAFPLQILISQGFLHGDTAYLVAYGQSMRSNGYIDQATHRRVCPNLNIGSPSNRIMFILP